MCIRDRYRQEPVNTNRQFNDNNLNNRNNQNQYNNSNGNKKKLLLLIPLLLIILGLGIAKLSGGPGAVSYTHLDVYKRQGNGPVDAFSNALMQQDEEELKSLKNYKFVHYHEHALGEGSHVKGVAYIQIDTGCTEPYFGIGISENINTCLLYTSFYILLHSPNV